MSALHNIELLQAKPKAQVLLCESMADFECAQKQLDADSVKGRVIAATWLGGRDGLNNADFSPLKGRGVVLLTPVRTTEHLKGALRGVDVGYLKVIKGPSDNWNIASAPDDFDLIEHAKQNTEIIWPGRQAANDCTSPEPAAPTDAAQAAAPQPVPASAPIGPAPQRLANRPSGTQTNDIDFIGFMEPVARQLLDEPSASSSTELRYGNNGSLSIDLEKGVWHDHEGGTGGGVLELIVREGVARDRGNAARWLKQQSFFTQPAVIQMKKPQRKGPLNIIARYPYTDGDGELLFEVCRLDPKSFRQRRPDPGKPGGWDWQVRGIQQVPYRLPNLLEAQPDAIVFVPEGEKDVDALMALGLTATCNAGGAGKWPDALAQHFAGRQVVILPDNDDAGREHARLIASKLLGTGISARILELPGLPPKGDASDWIRAGGTPEQLMQMAIAAPLAVAAETAAVLPRVCIDDIHTVGRPQAGRQTSVGDAVAELNKIHALTMMGGKVLVLRETVSERHGKELLYLSTAAFCTWYMNRLVPVEVGDKEGKPTTKYTPIADLWLKSPDRRQYEGVTFAPGNNAPSCYYNLWAGFAVEPMRGGLFDAAMKCRRLLSHVKYNLCSGDRGHFRYLLAWAADMVQDPDRKKGVALVLRGLKGTGKSIFGDALSALLGRHSMKVAHMRHLAGNFNRHLADKLLMVAEESFWAGDKSDEGPLKDMITSDRMTIEAKGVDAVEMPSLCRVMMITNNEWAVPASTDERRYFVLDVSARRRQDFDYFARIQQQLDTGGLGALLTVLQRFPAHQVNLRKVPETSGIRVQRALSLEPHDQFVFDALADGALLGREWSGPMTIDKEALYAAYIEAGRMRGKSHLKTKAHFAASFISCTGAVPARPRDGMNRLQVYRVPALSDATATFTKRCGVDVARLVEVADQPL